MTLTWCVRSHCGRTHSLIDFDDLVQPVLQESKNDDGCVQRCLTLLINELVLRSASVLAPLMPAGHGDLGSKVRPFNLPAVCLIAFAIAAEAGSAKGFRALPQLCKAHPFADRKSTRLNSSHT